MFREASLSNKKFNLLPMAGDLVLISSPVSVLDRKGAEDKIARRMKEMDKDGLDFTGMLSMMEKGDVKEFLSEKSKKMEREMSKVITQSHAAGPRNAPSVAPSLSQRARGPAPT